MSELFLTLAVGGLVVSQYYTIRTVDLICKTQDNLIKIVCEIAPDIKKAFDSSTQKENV
jgi:hypothetical protein